MSIRIGIYGYGNLGRGVECAIRQNPDMELVAVFTRRPPEQVKILTEGVSVYRADQAPELADMIDVMILCGGSATDLPVQTPALARHFNVVDSFDTHARIPEHFANVDGAAKAGGHVGIISVGWDPGMFSLNRMYAGAILPDGKDLAGEYLACVGADAAVEQGKAALLPGGKISVLCAAGPVWKEGKPDELKELSACYRACLELAAEKKFAAVDILAVPTGVYDSRLFQMATTTFQAVRDFQKTHEYPRKVNIVCQDDTMVMIYKQAYNFWFADVKSARMDYEGWD